MMIFESPHTCKSKILWWDTKNRVTQTPRSSAFVFDLEPQLRVQVIREPSQRWILSPAPHCNPECCEAPSNQARFPLSCRRGWKKRGAVGFLIFSSPIFLMIWKQIANIKTDTSWKIVFLREFQTYQQTITGRWGKFVTCDDQFSMQSWRFVPIHSRFEFRAVRMLCQIVFVVGQSQNKWYTVSQLQRQRKHMLESIQPRRRKISQVWILSFAASQKKSFIFIGRGYGPGVDFYLYKFKAAQLIVTKRRLI